jgi:hypothetical protein
MYAIWFAVLCGDDVLDVTLYVRVPMSKEPWRMFGPISLIFLTSHLHLKGGDPIMG